LQDKRITFHTFEVLGRAVKRLQLGALASLVILCGCSDDKQPKVYRLAKVDKKPAKATSQAVPHNDLGGLPPPPKPSAPVRWETPQEWKELPASGMRIASFTVEEQRGSIDTSLIFLGGKAGGDLSNVNRWREQLHEGPWSVEELEQKVRMEATPLGEAKVVSFSAKSGEGLLAAIIPSQSGTWFLKMVGPEAMVVENTPQFYSVLKSLQPSHE
jgi:hypothetical protein